MIFGIPGMAAANTVRAVTTAICTIWTMNGANQAGKFIKSRQIPICRVQYTTPNAKREYVRRPQAAKVSPGEIPVRQTLHRSAVSAFR